ncbi:DUF1289 domain-containing protein [Phenylobacterium sp.]|uniref:DUF1289 domain-containing protein n=1 Tax=Phenylobacterium sp. TaxID=1871053 RepID=UPI0040362738
MKVRSPCINVCGFDRRSGWCTGCGRTVPEIRDWQKMRPKARQAILSELRRRLDSLKASR